MTFRFPRGTHCGRQRGVSLIELMVALALGVVLVLGLTQVFGSVRASFGASEGIARLQENSRFALEFLRRDLRMASHLGCRSEYHLIDVTPRGYYNHLATSVNNNVAGYDTAPYVYRLHDALEVYDYSAGGGTSPGNTFAGTLAAFPSGVTAANSFTPALPTDLTTTGTGGLGTTGILGNDYGDLVPGSDVVVVRYLREDPIVLPGIIQQNDGVLAGTAAADFPAWTVFGATNCSAVSLFQITSSGPPAVSLASGTANLNRITWAQSGGAFANEPIYAAGTEVFRFEYVMYHVGRTGAQTPPALFRRRLKQAPANANDALNFGEAEELVPGVEMMQVLLGVDTSTTLDDQVDRYLSASQHLPSTLNRQQRFDAMRRVKTLRVSLLIRSPEPLPANAAPVAATRTVGDVVVTPPVDNRLRQVYDTTIALRNRIRN